MSAVIISAVLLLVVIGGSLTGFFARSNILDGELKVRSAAAADACADQALLTLANDPGYTGTLILALNALDSCRVSVTGSGVKSIKVQATSSKAVTNLQISYNAGTFAVVSWQEVPTY